MRKFSLKFNPVQLLVSLITPAFSAGGGVGGFAIGTKLISRVPERFAGTMPTIGLVTGSVVGYVAGNELTSRVRGVRTNYIDGVTVLKPKARIDTPIFHGTVQELCESPIDTLSTPSDKAAFREYIDEAIDQRLEREAEILGVDSVTLAQSVGVVPIEIPNPVKGKRSVKVPANDDDNA